MGQMDGPPEKEAVHDRLWTVMTEKHTPRVTTFKVDRVKHHELFQKEFHTDSDKEESCFTEKSFIPKVQIALQHTPKSCPRALLIERKRREFNRLDIAKELKDKYNLEAQQLMPKNPLSPQTVRLGEDPANPAPFLAYLPLEIFDNEEYEIRTPQEWLDLGVDEKAEGVRKPVPAVALIPEKDEDLSKAQTDPSVKYEWCKVGVLDYDSLSKLYLVHRCTPDDKVLDPDGKPVINGGHYVDDERVLLPQETWIPRIRVRFLSEDPWRFAKRVAEAYESRQACEAGLRYNLYVDCMPMDDIEDVAEDSFQKMEHFAMTTPGLRDKSRLEPVMEELKYEVNIAYKRSVNNMEFKKVVKQYPDLFTYVTLPSEVEPRAPESARWPDVPEYNYPQLLERMRFRYTLAPHPESVEAMGQVRAECNKVSFNMCLFYVPTPKPMRLDDFEQNQSQVTAHVALYLKDSWIQSLRSSIRVCLVNVGRGWYNLKEKVYHTYRMSQMSLIMETIRFMMQDSLRFLVKDSLISYCQMVVDACFSVTNIAEDFVWEDSLLTSPFKPKKHPLFMLDLTLELDHVDFSTKLEEFETSVINLFDNAINATQTVPQLEKFVMQDVFWSGTPLLESVGRMEPEVVMMREALRRSILTSYIPIRAYAKRFEVYLPVNNIVIKDYIEQFKKTTHGSEEVRKAVQKHLDDMAATQAAIPPNIIIGPYLLLTDGVKTQISKKQKALSQALLEMYAKELTERADTMSDGLKKIMRHLADKPNTIEELVEMREWIDSIPEKLAEHDDELEKLKDDHVVLEDFWYNLSNDEFTIKWEALSWPYKIMLTVDKTVLALEEDEDRFAKLQTSDTIAMEERLSGIAMQVQGMQSYSEIQRGHEFANEMRRVHKNLKECQQLAFTYNSREKLFGFPITNYEKIGKLIKEFEPYRNLWITTSDWLRWQESWMNDPIQTINPEEVERIVNESYKNIHKSVKFFHNSPEVYEIAMSIKSKIEDFKPNLPLLQGLRNPGMKARHWKTLSSEVGIPLRPSESLTFTRCLELGLSDHVEEISTIGEVAGKEYAIEQALDNMEKQWEGVNFEVTAYKNTGTFIMKITDEILQQLDDQIVMTQSICFSPYKKEFEKRIDDWDNTLRTTQDVLDEWTRCQIAWMYLEPIFSSDDITRQLPVESKRYQTMDRVWRKIMSRCKNVPNIIEHCPDEGLLRSLKKCNQLLDQVQKGLSEYLETKRAAFPRFYFLSDDELLEILSQTRDPTAVQPHLRKCFENVNRLHFEKDLKITKMFSAEGEVIDLREQLYPTGNVEEWMSEIERVMRFTVRQIIKESLEDYKKTARTKWVLTWPGQVVIAGCQTNWSAEITAALEANQLKERFDVLLKQLDDLRELVRTKLTPIGRMTLSALIVIEVHARDVVATMIHENVSNSNAFEWISQLRYYWMEDENLYQRAVNAQFPYGYEYLGNTLRLVITPLTDRCYLTLTGALHLKFGGAPAGPAGTGKTETTKDLGKAFAVQCVVFNCSDQLDVMAMGKFFKGLASSGAWACFDEFNRIDIEVLSVVAQQVTTIQKAQQQHLERFIFEGMEIQLKASCSVFITMNPGYAGRTELPDNLKALFRPVAMMVPDYALIAEISLFSFGFADARNLSKKIVTTFKLSSEQLSTQDHYDFGMRAVKSVISAAGNLKRQNPDMVEELITLRAIRDVNVPKFLVDDLKLFKGIVSDLFPAIREQPIDYGNLDTALHETCLKNRLKDVEGFLKKCIQLFETTVVRHGLMLVGPAVSGKTKCYDVLKKAMTSLKGEMSPSGMQFEAVHTYVLNPKSITMGQLYGEFDLISHEWTDGILSSLIRHGAACEDLDKRWYIFDGPVDAVWIENMNTVLDDNKKLCLTSGEIIKLTEPMTMMFEVADLAVASPATVSRCGMVYLEPSYIGLEPFVHCWLQTLPPNVRPYEGAFTKLFDYFLQPVIKFLRTELKEIVPSLDGGLVFNWVKLIDSFFPPFIQKEGKRAIPAETKQQIPKLIEPWVVFSMVWSVGATCDNDSRVKFSNWVRDMMKKYKCSLPFPPEGLVYDYKLDDGVTTGPKPEDSVGEEDEEQEAKWVQVLWRNWMYGTAKYVVSMEMKYSDIMVPTIDTVRSAHIIGMLVNIMKPVLCIGPTGTGKTMTIADKLMRDLPKEFVPEFIVFSAKTSANQTQDVIDGKLDKRRKGVYGPPLGRYAVIFIDDLNMPALEVFGAQPPIELIRQYMDFGGWYDRKLIGEFRNLVDVNFMASMGPPGGGRNPVTARLLRHFNYLAFTEMEDPSKHKIFSVILASWLSGNPDLLLLCDKLVDTCISTYNTVTKQLLPTPAKSHYTFNLRDLSKVFQGIHMATSREIKTTNALLGLWYHENCRVFQDRLVNEEDRNWFEALLAEKMQTDFGLSIDEVITKRPYLFCDFLGDSDEKEYVLVDDNNKIAHELEEMLEEYNQINTAQMKLVLFMDAVRHVCRITRVIRQPLGNALLLGMGGSGRQSLTRLSAHVSEFDCFQIELSKNYGITDWRDDLKTLMMKAGVEAVPTVFLFSDTQIKSESFLEDINNILNAGDVPNIYSVDELETIYNAMKPVLLNEGIQATKTNLFSAYTKTVRSNLHTVITMSPLGEVFRARLRQFPALVNCCTIDWFSEWPAEALQSVALRFLGDLPDLDCSEEVMNGLVAVCQEMQQSVSDYSVKFKVEMSRYNYVTPTSYLELLGIFSNLIKRKKAELLTSRKRLKTGLDKLLATAEEVSTMQVELAEMGPQLESAVKEATVTMEQIAKDTKVAEETKKVVTEKQQSAAVKAKEAQAIADDAQKDLNAALPALEAALASLKSLNKNDVVEVRALQRPPDGVRLVVETVCIMKCVKPKKVASVDKPGQKVDDYWDVGKALLQDPGKFLDSLLHYDKDNIPDDVIKKIQPYIDNDNFTPPAIAKVSKACTSICEWVRAMHTYYFVAKAVAPKRAALKMAQGELEDTQKVLWDAMKTLKEVEDGVAKLQENYKACVKKKKTLENKCKQCEQRLIRADKLINGLADEKNRWIESVDNLEAMQTKIVGDVMVSSAVIAYQGPFTSEYRLAMTKMWVADLDEHKVPRTDDPTLVGTMSDPVSIRAWQIAGLPNDNLSIENGVIVQFSRRWPLFIDPQGQANKWVKNMEKDAGLEVVKQSDKDFLRSLENSVRFGKPCLLENISIELDPALEPVLLRQTFKQQGTTVIKIGDSVIPYHPDFKFYLTTKLPNPHYTPEVSTKVTLVNFTLSPSGLQDQLLGIAVAQERPDLEELKNQLIVNSAQMKAQLKEIEDKILQKLSASEGSPVDDIDLINTLEASKLTSSEIKVKVAAAEETEKDIDVTRSQYIPVAINTQVIFFCVADMCNIDPMYQYSLDWFVNIFISSIDSCEKADTIQERVENINNYFTFSLYCNVCRSLFEKHKLLFAFLLCSRLGQYNGTIDMEEYRLFVAGGSAMPVEKDNPAPDWMSDRSWKEILTLAVLPTFVPFVHDFSNHLDEFKAIFDNPEPHREPLPGEWNETLDSFQKMLVVKALRLDKVTNAMQDYVSFTLGQRFIEPQTTQLSEVFSVSSPTVPLIFILSTGTDPALALYKFADEMKFSKKLNAISLGQGQGPLAEELMKTAMSQGKWVFFQNCHLAPSWMPSLEGLVEQIDPQSVHKDFRLWLTSMPSARFPVFILQNGSKMTVEPPKGIKANLLRSYGTFTDTFLTSIGDKSSTFKHLLLSLCLFHGVLLERRKFGALGFNIPYEFTDGDLRICISQLKMFLNEYSEVPYKVLKYTAGHINYGGRVTDDWDRRCLMSVLSDYYHEGVVNPDYIYSASAVYRQLNPEFHLEQYMEYIRSLPINDTPEIFGLHDNANITFAQNETFHMLEGLVALQPKTASGAGKTREEVMDETAHQIMDDVPQPMPVGDVMEKYPVLYEQSMNTVLVQEVIRYNRLLSIIHQSLKDLLKAVKGLVVMSQDLEQMADSLYMNSVPAKWAGKAYPSLKPLGSWVIDLTHRVDFIKKWIDEGIPGVFWISGFFFPQAFLTGTLQNFARKMKIPIDTISFEFRVMKEKWTELSSAPTDGCYIRGLFVEGARFDHDQNVLTESRPKELFTDMQPIWLIPVSNRKVPETGIYECPLYKTLTRAGTLSTTGHSTNFVFTVEVPSNQPQHHWIKRGVAMLCALNY
ncbi:dynein axonemal heavy chain 1-like [Babylonia areolata]|uniref:dynein axonemal heavy chain 1-like n=1 Tax=Babylonia areolata TaxID=304850 RepID=UPI003FD11915